MIGHSHACDKHRCSQVDLISTSNGSVSIGKTWRLLRCQKVTKKKKEMLCNLHFANHETTISYIFNSLAWNPLFQ